MFELVLMSILGASYIVALKNEKKEAIEQKRKEEIGDLKLKIFCYAIKHKILYNEVVDMIKHNIIDIDDIFNGGEE